MPSFKVGDDNTGVRADIFLSKKMSDFSRSSLKGLFIAQQVTLDKEIVKPSHRLKAGDRLSVNTKLLSARPKVIKFPIIYEDDDVIVINKPSGVLTHSKGAINLEATVASSLRSKIDTQLTGNRAGIVHRLDRVTSGLLILAKHARGLKYLQKQFATHKVQKQYLAVVEGIPSLPEAKIDVPIARNPKKPQTFMASSAGKSATTSYRVEQRLTHNGKRYVLLSLQPKTGRTHQIRVHLSYIGHPVVGDRVYGHQSTNMLLHASQLTLHLPSTKKMSFKAPLPDYFYDFGVTNHGL